MTDPTETTTFSWRMATTPEGKNQLADTLKCDTCGALLDWDRTRLLNRCPGCGLVIVKAKAANEPIVPLRSENG